MQGVLLLFDGHRRYQTRATQTNLGRVASLAVFRLTAGQCLLYPFPLSVQNPAKPVFEFKTLTSLARALGYILEMEKNANPARTNRTRTQVLSRIEPESESKLEFGMYPQSMPTEWTHARTLRPWQSVRLDL